MSDFAFLKQDNIKKSISPQLLCTIQPAHESERENIPLIEPVSAVLIKTKDAIHFRGFSFCMCLHSLVRPIFFSLERM
jgi:hypothetical protein